MDKIIINHGERVTEHELGSTPLVIGRDPECDLFFADKKLSRRHARIERVGPRVRLVDLGSRNGSWVNEERIQERELAPGDEIRLGGLRISFEPEPVLRAAEVEEEGDQSTVYLTAGAPSPESGTVLLPPNDLEPQADSSQTVALVETPPLATAPGSDDSATVFLSAATAPRPTREGKGDEVEGEGESEISSEDEGFADELDETLPKPEPERTVMLETRSTPSKEKFDTGQVLFRGQAGPPLQHPQAKTRPASAKGAAKSELPEERAADLERSQPSLTASVTFVPEVGFGRRSWSVRFALLIGGLVLFALFVVAFPLMRILRPALVEESRLRARALVDLLAAINEESLGEGRLQDLSVERVTREPGVTAAYILSPAGAILAPADRAGETPALEGLGGSLGDVRTFRDGTSSKGEWLLAQPISYRGRRVGTAIVSLSPPKAASGAATLAFVVGGLLLLMGAAMVVLLGRKLTMAPIEELRRDVDAFVDGQAATIHVERPYGELSLLALSLNRLLALFPFAARRGGSGTGAP